MLTMFGSPYRKSDFCDGVSRRSLLQIGTLGAAGLTLPGLLKADAAAGRTRSNKSVILIFLAGGQPHQDMVDLKPNAPAEIRGEFSPISTSLPGFQICEYMPRMAKLAHTYSTIRSLVGSEGRHDAFQCMTGHTVNPQPQGGWPSMGSVVSKLHGAAAVGVPPFVSLSPRMKHAPWGDPGQPGFLGQSHAAFAPNADKIKLSLAGVSGSKLNARKNLLQQLDRLKQDIDQNDALAGMDSHYQQAFGILTSSRLADALDVTKEDPRIRERYQGGSEDNAGYGDAGPLNNDYLLQARRLVEAGVRVVTVAYGRWDWHGRPHGTNFDNARDHLPIFDKGFMALLEDLRERGLDRDVTVLVWGEFGRTPRINKNGGRDHWPAVGCAWLAGGGIRPGQVIGSTTPWADQAKERPVHFQEIFATVYHNLGIDVNHATVPDTAGRPHYLVDHGRYQPLSELV